MSFFRINLNRLEDPTLALRKQRRETWGLLVLAGGLLTLVVLTSQYLGGLRGKIQRLESVRSDLFHQIDALERDSNYVSEDDVRSLHDLDRQRTFWTRKLVSLAELLGEKIVLTRVDYDGSRLTLDGLIDAGTADHRGTSGNQFSKVSAFVDSLQASPEFSRDFRKVEFLSSRRLDFQDQDLLNFAVLCQPK
jgi:Tfp pilus assembly protein PilN